MASGLSKLTYMTSLLMVRIAAGGVPTRSPRLSTSLPSVDALPPGYVIGQNHPHEHTATAACKHVRELDRYTELSPIPDHTREAFAAAAEWLAERSGRTELLLDSGCGTGRSTLLLAQQNPSCAVIGIDRSLTRLSKDKGREGASLRATGTVAAARDGALVQPLLENALLVRADLPAFWRLAVEARWRVRAHRMLFPNPYPKPAHLGRRWHGHPSWPLVLRLGGDLELRSNWRTYLDETLIATEAIARLAQPSEDGTISEGLAHRPEVQAAVRALTVRPFVKEYTPSAPFASEFEEKYHCAALPLYRLVLALAT